MMSCIERYMRSTGLHLFCERLYAPHLGRTQETGEGLLAEGGELELASDSADGRSSRGSVDEGELCCKTKSRQSDSAWGERERNLPPK